VELDPSVRDIYGIPVVKIHMADSENESAMIKDIGESAGEMLEATGAKNVRTYAHPSAPRWAAARGRYRAYGSRPKEIPFSINFSSHTTSRTFSSWTPAVYVQSMPKSHAYHHGAVRAFVRLRAGFTQEK